MTSQLNRLIPLALIAALAPAAQSDYNSKAVNKAGFPAKPGQFDGQDLDNYDGKVKAAIANILARATACGDQEGIECAKGLEKMRDAKRICVERGDDQAVAWGSTLPDGKKGCEGDGMNLSPRVLCSPGLLEAVLVHEWVHVNQTKPYLEKPAYEAEKEYLLKAGVPPTNGYLKQICCIIDSLCKKPAKKKKETHKVSGEFEPTTPEWGFASLILGSEEAPSVFFVDESTNDLASYPAETGETSHFQLDMLLAFSVVEVPTDRSMASPIVAVGGAREDGSGVVQYLAVDDALGQVVGSLGSVLIPNGDPLSMAFDTVHGELVQYVLDTHGGKIWIVRDTDGDGLPETVNPTPWADLLAFPGTEATLSIQTNEAYAGSVILKAQDTRLERFVDLETPMWALFDTDADQVADARIDFLQKEVTAIVPFAASLPCDGDMEVELFGTIDAKLELWTADAAGNVLQFLGAGIADGDNQAVVDLVAPLVFGDTLAVLDLENYATHVPGVFQAQSVCFYGSGCPGPAGEPEPDVTHSGTSSIGGTLNLEIYGLAGGATLLHTVGVAPQAIPVPGGVRGCTLLTTAESTSVVVSGPDGTARAPLALPSDPSWIGTELFAQWLVLDPRGIYSTQGQRVVVLP